jgi:hypothetical protein
MSIELHCPHCGKLIRAPDDAGGKHGKCPSCMHSLYIPMRVADDDLIPLAPVDEDAEQRAQRLHEESSSYAALLDHEPSGATAAHETRGPAPRPSRPEAPPGEVIDMPALVAKFVTAMRDSKLDEADRIAARLEKAGVRARDYVESLYLDQMPPTIKDVPPPLVKGFLKALLDRLGSGAYRSWVASGLVPGAPPPTRGDATLDC